MRSATRNMGWCALLCLLAGCGQESKPLPAVSASGVTASQEEISAAAQLQQRKWSVGREFITQGPVTSLATPMAMKLPDGIPAEDLKFIGALRNLNNLQLTDVRLDEPLLVFIGKIDSLKALGISSSSDFQRSTFPVEGAKHLLGLKKLESLTFVGTDLTDDAIEILSNIKTVRSVYLFGTRVTDTGIKAVAQMPQLDELQLSQQVTDAGLQELAAANSLKLLKLPLDIRPPGITDAGLADFRKAHPTCKIE